jgi:hypothetical protein
MKSLHDLIQRGFATSTRERDYPAHRRSGEPAIVEPLVLPSGLGGENHEKTSLFCLDCWNSFSR